MNNSLCRVGFERLQVSRLLLCLLKVISSRHEYFVHLSLVLSISKLTKDKSSSEVYEDKAEIFFFSFQFAFVLS